MTTYADLLTAVTAYSARSDLGPQHPTFLLFAEKRINREVMALNQHVDTTLTVDNTGKVALPARFLGFRSVTIAPATGAVSRSRKLDYLAPDAFHEKDNTGCYIDGSFRNSFYTIQGTDFLLYPKPEGAATTDVAVVYWQAYEGLNDSTNTTHALIQEHYDLYLHAMLIEVHRYLMDEQAKLGAMADFATVVNEIRLTENRKQQSRPLMRKARIAN